MQAKDLIRERNVNNSLQLLLVGMATAPCFQGGPFLTGATVVLSSCAIIIQGHIATHRHIHAILHCCLPAGDSLAGRGRPGASVHLTLHATGPESHC